MHVYLITNLINSKHYIGAEKGNNSDYFGSGKLIGEAIKEFGKENFKKGILIDDRYVDNWEECLELESACILSLDTLRPNGYNILFWNWPFPFKILSKSGKKGGKITGRKSFEEKKGIFAPGMCSKAGKLSGRKSFEEGIGIFSLANKDKHSEWRRKGGKIIAKRNEEQGKAIFAPGMARKGGKISGKLNAYTLFEIDGLTQQTTLGAIFRE